MGETRVLPDQIQVVHEEAGAGSAPCRRAGAPKKIGVDGMITDYPNRLRDVMVGTGIKLPRKALSAQLPGSWEAGPGHLAPSGGDEGPRVLCSGSAQREETDEPEGGQDKEREGRNHTPDERPGW